MKCAGAVRALLLIAFMPPLRGQVRTYLTLDIDPASRMARLRDEVSLRPPTVEHFQVGLGPSWRIDRVRPAGPDTAASYLEYFHVNKDSVLLDRSKYQEIFSGKFGVIVAQTDYCYESEYGPGFGAPSLVMGVRADKTAIRRERPI